MLRSLFSCVLAAHALAFAPGCGAADVGDSTTADPIEDADVESSTTTTELVDVDPGSPVTFDVGADVLGFTVTVVGDPARSVGIASLRAPSGVAAVSDFAPEGTDESMALSNRGLGAVAVPESDGTAMRALERGTWTLTAGAYEAYEGEIDKTLRNPPRGAPSSAPVRVRVVYQRTSDGEFHGGALDLHVYVPGGLHVSGPGAEHTVTASSAETDPAVQARIDAFYTELDQYVGIGRGSVVYHALDARFLHNRNGGERTAFLQEAGTTDTPALHVLLTEELPNDLLGYTEGVPGTVGLGHTARSGIAVSLTRDAHDDAVTIFHEMGHFIGLMHSTEYDGTPDLLADTPSCRKNQDPCPDIDNLMNPDGPLGETQLSAEQIRIFRGAPIYRAARSEAPVR